MKKSLWNLDHWLGDRIGDKKVAINLPDEADFCSP
jgi:hypothetical protein